MQFLRASSAASPPAPLPTLVTVAAALLAATVAAQPAAGDIALQRSIAGVAAALGGERAVEYRHAMEAEVPGLAAQLAPTLACLPRDDHGKLNAAGVRYALHRMFVRARGWHVAGLDPRGQAWNASLPPIHALDSLPEVVRNRWELGVNKDGFDPEDVPALAATIEYFVHAQAVDRLRGVYDVLNLSASAYISEQDALKAVAMNLGSYILGKSFSNVPQSAALLLYEQMPAVYPSWPRALGFIAETAATLRKEEPLKSAQGQPHALGDAAAGGAFVNSSGAGVTAFSTMSSVARALSDRFGPWQDSECKAMKSKLVSMEEEGGTGRVKLSDFHSGALQGDWQFGESTAYLRTLGALDEENPMNLRVIIPNYVNSLSNCVVDSPYYSVCCISECEDIMLRVERGIARPEAPAAEVAAVVAQISSATVPSNRTLTPLEHQRLHSIASMNEGLVPIYGRLFAQWMHHAYPRECPYPHLSGTTRPEMVDLWSNAGFAQVADPVELMQNSLRVSKRKGAPVQAPAWSHQEDLAGLGEFRRPLGWAFLHVNVTLTAVALLLFVATKTAFIAAGRGKGASRAQVRSKCVTGRATLEV